MLVPLALAFGSLVLTALLAEHRHRLAAGAAVLLVPVALTYLDIALESLTLPPYAGRGVLVTAASHAAASLPAVGPAVLAGAELVAYLLLVVGLVGRYPQRAEPA
ncbi:hypothetical protein [Micromonospora sp. CP22]|uniref:hypothetical protein n=1 Tax=Micromonospora sp. CP22 TaxID=2580517 RepID=UPI0012BB78FF|nr:hypothetical protein [Micromonospora sp. CP22]MTK01332.1 hypothetical protein [Micromonospora sp. CP22]